MVEEIRTPMVNLEVLVEEVIMVLQEEQEELVIHHHLLQHKVQMAGQVRIPQPVAEAVQYRPVQHQVLQEVQAVQVQV